MHTSTRTSFPQGSLFSTTYGPKTLRIGMKSQPDGILNKPCVGVEPRVDRNEDCLRTTLRRNEGGRIGRAAQTILWDDPREAAKVFLFRSGNREEAEV